MAGLGMEATQTPGRLSTDECDIQRSFRASTRPEIPIAPGPPGLAAVQGDCVKGEFVAKSRIKGLFTANAGSPAPTSGSAFFLAPSSRLKNLQSPSHALARLGSLRFKCFRDLQLFSSNAEFGEYSFSGGLRLDVPGDFNSQVPAMNFDWWNYGGILRDVFYVERPRIHVRDYKVQLKKGSRDVIA